MRSIILIGMTILLLVGVAQADDSSPTLSSDIGYIYVWSSPVGGSIYIDGNYEGTTHSSSKDYVITDSNSIPVTAGYHNIEIFKDGYEKYSTSIYVDSGYSVARYVTLIPISTPTPTPTATSLAKISYKALTIGESWDIGRGYILTASSIDAKATPRQVWLVLSKDGIKLDDKILSEGQTYNFNNIIITKINKIWAGPTSDLVELTDAYTAIVSTTQPTTTAPWTNVGSKVLTVGETWDVGYGWTLSANSIDAKATPRQVWLTLSKDGYKLDDKILNDGQTYNWNDIFITKINRIWAGQTSDSVELTDAVVNLASIPTPTLTTTSFPTETFIPKAPESQNEINLTLVNAILLILLIGTVAVLFRKLKAGDSKANEESKPSKTRHFWLSYLRANKIEEHAPKDKSPQKGKIAKIIMIILLIFIGATGYTIYQKYSPLAELANCGNNCIDYKKVRVAQYETSVPDIKITNADTDKLIMDVPIIIHNPSAKDTETVKIDFDLYMEEKHLTKGSIPAYELPAKQNTTILIKDVVIKYEELGEVLQKVAERHGAEMTREGKANISMTTDLLIYFPIELFSINIYTFIIPIQIESEVPVDMLKQNEEAKRQIDEKVKTALKEVQEKIKDTLPALPTKTIPSPTATLPQKTALPLPTSSYPQFP